MRALDICAVGLARDVAQAEEICSRLRPEKAPGQITAEMFRRRVAAVRYELDELRKDTERLLAAAIAEVAECERAAAVEFIARHLDHATDRISLLFDAGHGRMERLQLWVANGRIQFDDADRRRIQDELRKGHELELLGRANARNPLDAVVCPRCGRSDLFEEASGRIVAHSLPDGSGVCERQEVVS